MVLFADKLGNQVRLFLLTPLRDFEEAASLSWGIAVLACLYRELCRATSPDSSGIVGPLILLQIVLYFFFLNTKKKNTIIDAHFCRHGRGSASTLVVRRG